MKKAKIIYKAPKMPMQKPGKRVKGTKYVADLEEEDIVAADEDNHPRRKPSDIGQALKRAKEGYSKKPRVKPQKKKQR